VGLRTLLAKARLLETLDRLPYPASAAVRSAAVDEVLTALDGVTAADVTAATWADLHTDAPAPPNFRFLGTAGAVAELGATTTTASSTTAVYYEVPAGKVAYVYRLKGDVYDDTAALSTLPQHFGATAAPTAGSGLRVRTVDTDHTTALTTLCASADNNLTLLFLTGTPISEWTAADGYTPTAATHLGCNLKLDWKFSQPLVLTAGQRFEVKHLENVAYSLGAWCIEVSEVTL